MLLDLKFVNNFKFLVKFGRATHTLPEPRQAHRVIELNEAKHGRISQEIIELNKNGCSLHEIARQVTRSRSYVRSLLHRHGIFTEPPLDESKVTAWRKRRRTHAHPPFGYTYYLGKVVIEPREHEILLLIERLANEGMNPNAIAKYLNEQKLYPRRAKVWNRNSVVLILQRTQSN